MDIVITAKDTKHVTFPYGGNLGYMPPDHQGFGITSKNGQETRYTVPNKHWGTLRGFPLKGLELPIAAITLKKLEQHPKKTPIESIIWVRENNEYANMLTTWGITPGTPVFPSMWLLGSIMGTLEKHTLHDSSQRKMLGVGVLLVVLAYLWGALLTVDMFTLNPDWVPHMILVFGLFVLTAPRNVLPNTGTALLGLWRYYHPQETPPHTRKTLHEKNGSTGIC